MRRIRGTYIYQNRYWPEFSWDQDALYPLLYEIQHKQGRLLGYMEMAGFNVQNETLLNVLTNDVVKSSEIEGEFLNRDQVRSSVARQLGLEVAGLVPSDRHVDGVVEMLLDATRNHQKRLTAQRLFGWHAALFPTGYSGMHKITVGTWRKNDKGPMQVVSGAMGKEKVHFEAPHADRVAAEMKAFLFWLNNTRPFGGQVIDSAVAHLWFVTIHPFDDGNGRIARAISDMLLTRSDNSRLRFYSMSTQIRLQRKSYYTMLEKTQKGNLDITEWVRWYLNCLNSALDETDAQLQKVVRKTRFWDLHRNTPVNERQRAIINRMFDGFEGKLTSSKWAKINKCSPDTALRDITDLLEKKILKKDGSGGRSTAYVLAH